MDRAWADMLPTESGQHESQETQRLPGRYRVEIDPSS